MTKAWPLLAFFALGGCSLNALALRSTVNLLDRGAAALYEEPDPALARESLPAQLKLLESLLRNDPGNAKLLALAAEGFNGYAFLFLEDADPARARALYLRGRDYALRLLARDPALQELATLPQAQFAAAVAQAKPQEAAALFWAGFGWSGAINLSKDSPAAVADLPKAAALMSRVEELAPDYHFAGSDLFFGVYYASRPPLLGGDVKKAKAHFDEALRRTGGRYLMAYLLEARYYAVATQDQALFRDLLAKIEQAPAGELPMARLTDEVAKSKAAVLKEKINDLF